MNITVIQSGIHSTNLHPYVEERVVCSKGGQVYEYRTELSGAPRSSADVLLSFYDKSIDLIDNTIKKSVEKYPELLG